VLEDYQRAPLIRPRAVLARELRQRGARAKTDNLKHRALNQFKDRELFRIDMVHLMDSASTLPDFSRALTELAEVVLAQAATDCQAALAKPHGMPLLTTGAVCPFTMLGLGKFGGCELGYASDIEVLFVYGGPGRTSGRKKLDNSEYFERLVQTILQRIEAKQEGIFHLDVRLRPHGGKGLLANTLDEVGRYYAPNGLAAPFERQALIKLRYVGGDEELGRSVETRRDAFVYSGHPWDIAIALDLRRRQIKELTESGRTNVKYSPGGLIDIEYAVQYLQLMHGHQEARLRSPNTLEALDALAETHVVTTEETAMLREAYLFLRLLIDGLRIVRGHAKDLLLPSSASEEFVFLARRLGYRTDTWEEGASKLSTNIRRHMDRTGNFFTSRFGKL
jgi:glutamate-ammonia-ligase adenylyltransferase